MLTVVLYNIDCLVALEREAWRIEIYNVDWLLNSSAIIAHTHPPPAIYYMLLPTVAQNSEHPGSGPYTRTLPPS